MTRASTGRLVEAMGGRIGVASRAGEGSTFFFEITLPVVPDDKPLHPHVAGKRARLLIADPDARSAVSRVLRREGVIMTDDTDPNTGHCQAEVLIADAAGAPPCWGDCRRPAVLVTTGGCDQPPLTMGRNSNSLRR